jgi:hypothetical protein
VELRLLTPVLWPFSVIYVLGVSFMSAMQLLFCPVLDVVRLHTHRALLEREKADLLQEMMSLPQNAVVRRINELVKRARAVKVHAYIVHYLKKQMPYVLGTVHF